MLHEVMSSNGEDNVKDNVTKSYTKCYGRIYLAFNYILRISEAMSSEGYVWHCRRLHLALRRDMSSVGETLWRGQDWSKYLLFLVQDPF